MVSGWQTNMSLVNASFDRESTLRDRAYDDVPGIAAADQACRVLQQANSAVASMRRVHYVADEAAQGKAVLYLGVEAIRAVRCLVSLIAVGYQAEALVFLRKLLEIQNQLEKVTHPDNGLPFTAAWLADTPNARGQLPPDLEPEWKYLHRVAHADSRGITNHTYQTPHGTATFSDIPRRDSRAANHLATWTAVVAQHIALLSLRYSGALCGEMGDLARAIETEIKKEPSAYPYKPSAKGYTEDQPDPA
jgi:hypothetical protein